MSDTDVLPARFTISAAAKREIEKMRVDWAARFADPADVVTISWGECRPQVGASFGSVIVSFYGRSRRDEVARGIQPVSGLPVVFFTVAVHVPRFEGKVVDFEPSQGFQGFFLREP